MAVNPKSLANLRPPWKPGENGNPNGQRVGRKPSRIKMIEKQEQISAFDRKNVAAFLLDKTIDEIKEVLNDPEQPAFVTAVAAAIIADGKKGITDTWQMLLDWNLGKAEQTVNENVKTVRDLTDQELAEEKRRLIAEELRKLGPDAIKEILEQGD